MAARSSVPLRVCPRRQSPICLLMLVAFVALPGVFTPAYADDRALDPTFGGDGRVTTDFFGTREAAAAVVVQPDGRVIAAGFAIDPVSRRADFALARYLHDGTLDASFGSGGKVVTDFSGGNDGIGNLVLQPDGKIVAAGGAAAGSEFALALARYTASGALDGTFGSGGRVIVNGLGGATGLALQPDGKLVVADTFTGIVRLNADGSLDSTFGTGGRVTTGRGQLQLMLEALALQSDGRIVATGSDVIIVAPDPEGGFLGRQVFAVLRFNADGSVDSTFGTGGELITDAGTINSGARAVVVQSDDKIVAVGVVNSDFGLVRYNTDGSLDTTFADGGKVTTDFLNNTADIANGVAIAPDHTIVAVGSTNLGDFPTDTFALARYVGATSPADALRALQSAVNGLVQSGVLNQGQGHALTAPLNAAASQLGAGNFQAAADQLNAFLNQVNALVNAGTLSTSQAQPLIDQANEILRMI